MTATVTFRWTIAYVEDVTRSTDFYSRAFGLPVRFTDPAGQFAEMDTGATILAFATHDLARSNLPEGYTGHDPSRPPLAVELAFVTDDVPGTVAAALAAGARQVTEPAMKPWGQTVAYVRDPDGVLIEIASAMS